MLTSLIRTLFPRSGQERQSSFPPVESLPGLEGIEDQLEAGETEAAERRAQARLAVAPEDPDALGALAAVRATQGRLADACGLADRMLAAGAPRSDRLCAAAEINRRAGRDGVALSLAQAACALDAGEVLPWILKAISLETLGRAAEAYEAYRQVIERDPANRAIHSSMLFMLYTSGLFPPERVTNEHRVWAAKHADPHFPAGLCHANVSDPGRKLRVGYVSADFRRHVVAYFFEPVLEAHDRARVHVTCYASSSVCDDKTLALRELADEWRDISKMDDEEAAQAVRLDEIDVLVDLSGHTRGNRLGVFARRPAPVQATWLGYLGTTGMRAMDYCITDRYCDPPGSSERHYTEALLRMPHSQWCYRPADDAPPVSPSPREATGKTTFVSIANFGRLTDGCFQAWARILGSVPGSRLQVMGAVAGDPTDRLLAATDREGVEAGRIELTPQMPHQRYLERLAGADIVLGAYPFTGATTTCEALWMGLPVVCLAGDTRASRSSASILSAVGLEDLVARDWDAYRRIAIGLAGDPAGLARLRAGLRERLLRSPVMDPRGFTDALEKLYREAWQKWCCVSPPSPEIAR